MSQEISEKTLNHIAIIPDGNRRWAKINGLPTLMGHKKGFDAVKSCATRCRELGIHTMTFWGFSTENWSRSKEEIDYLWKIFADHVDKYIEECVKEGCRVHHLGRKDRLPSFVVEKLLLAEEQTKDLTKYTLNIALDYGGHDEILRAFTKFMADVKTGKINSDDAFKQISLYKNKYPVYLFDSYLDTGNQLHPYPDLVIRTSGEQRLSGYLSWQSAYSELYFTKLHMPDFNGDRLEEAINDFIGRERRFGGNAA